jgi:GT2 family glycosyltransferase
MKWNDTVRIKEYFRQVNWALLAFLILFLNVKLPVKMIGIAFVFFLHRKSFIPREIIRKGWIRFYVVMILLAGINWLVAGFGHLSLPALLSFGLGCTYWLLAMAASGHLFYFVRQGDRDTLHRTAEIFFLLHIACVLFSFLAICIAAGSINPYTFQGLHQKYFLNTGDFIKGISFDSSVTSAMISAFGLLYFLYRGRLALSLLCMITVLLAGSNFVDLLLTGILIFVFIFHTDRVQKSMILVYWLMIVVFMGRISPQNKSYAEELLSKLGRNEAPASDPATSPQGQLLVSGGTTAMTSQAHASLPVNLANTHLREIDFLPEPEMIARQATLRAFRDSVYSTPIQDSLNRKYMARGMPGRWIAWQELGDLFRAHPAQLIGGAGMGNFSSRLAFKTTALGIGGTYPQALRYCNPLFRDHYLYLYLYYYTRDQGGHSVVNMPDSVYGQLLGEYGLAGIVAFFLLYAGYFLRRVRSLSYGLPLVLFLGSSFFMEYWFEQLSIVVLFEFLLLLDQQPEQQPATRSGSARAESPGSGPAAIVTAGGREAVSTLMPRVTVLMPAYNAGKYIADAIRSVLDQSFADFELLIVDDGSTDNTVDIVNSFTDPRIRLQIQSNKGISVALNAGLKASRGYYIARFDADDICFPQRLARQVTFLDAQPACLVVGSDAEYISENGDHLFDFQCSGHSHAEILEKLYSVCPFIHSGVMYRKDAILQAGGYSLFAYNFEDHLLWVQLLRSGKCANLPEALIKVRINPNSVTIDEKWRGRRFRRLKRRCGIVGDHQAPGDPEDQGRRLSRSLRKEIAG